jgi:general secretion pathway protein F
MSAYRWEAVDAQGRVKEGLLEAETARAARDQLRAGGLTPTAIAAAPAIGDASTGVRLPPPLLAMTTRQLATLTQSGLPLDQALAAVAEQADDRRAARLTTQLRAQVSAGESLPAALARYPRAFSPLYRGLVGAGAETGRLPEVLARLADYLEAREAMRQKVVLALIYPALVTLISFAVIAVLLVYVVPQVVAVYEQSRQTLPWLTRALIATSAFLRATGWLWLALAAAAIVAFGVAYRRPAFRARWHAFVLRMPVAGRLARSLDTARFASTLAILVGSGAPLLRSLDAAADVVRMLPLRAAAAKAAGLVREGVALSRALREQRMFPPVLMHLVANGEQSGRLAPMLARAAEELERDAERRLAWLAALLQPALIVLMGGIVLVLVLAIMLPIVSMNQLIR